MKRSDKLADIYVKNQGCGSYDPRIRNLSIILPAAEQTIGSIEETAFKAGYQAAIDELRSGDPWKEDRCAVERADWFADWLEREE